MKKILISFFFFSLLLLPAFFQFTDGNVVLSSNIAYGDPKTVVGETPETKTTGTFTNPMKGVNNVNQLIGKVINAIMGVVGSLALLMFVFGGLTWMTSGGSQEKVKKGKDILVWSAIGLVIIFSAYGITNLIINYTTK